MLEMFPEEKVLKKESVLVFGTCFAVQLCYLLIILTGMMGYPGTFQYIDF